MIANHKLIIHGISAEKWARRFDLEPFTVTCDGCGEERTTSLPFADGELRGLVAPACKCTDPNVGPPYCAVRHPRYGDLLEGLR